RRAISALILAGSVVASFTSHTAGLRSKAQPSRPAPGSQVGLMELKSGYLGGRGISLGENAPGGLGTGLSFPATLPISGIAKTIRSRSGSEPQATRVGRTSCLRAPKLG